jgi:23S rRNA (adenine2503-C2)-methyltransferase
VNPAPRPASGPVPPLARLPDEWAEALVPLGGRRFHAKQVFRWVQARGVLDPSQMTDLPTALREKLAAEDPAGTVAVTDERRAADGTRKLVVRVRDGKTVETVLIPGVTGPKGSRTLEESGPERERGTLPSPVPQEWDDADADDGVDVDDTDGAGQAVRVSQCISTQVGCAMGCVFCASGVAGIQRNLGADEIVAQVLEGRARLGAEERLTNVVYMGMGEPLANYEATARSLRLLTHPEGIALSARRITVSTSGLVPEIARLGADFGGKVGLAVSLHAADDETRTRLMPINKKYPLAVLMEALRAYPLPARRRITIEYTLVAGKNDDAGEARKLARLLRGLAVKVNLIPMNPIAASSLGPPEMSGVLQFQRVLCDAGYSCFIRRRRGDDVAAACGQLALAGAKPKVRVHRA